MTRKISDSPKRLTGLFALDGPMNNSFWQILRITADPLYHPHRNTHDINRISMPSSVMDGGSQSLAKNETCDLTSLHLTILGHGGSILDVF
jgi:hypothetical protein